MARQAEASSLGASRVIADAGPLIALARVGRLGLLERLFASVAVTPEVRDELGIGEGAPGAASLADALAQGWLVVLPGPGTERDRHALLDRGEASCIAAALETGALLMMDERLGRREAKRLGLPLTGTAGVLCAAKARGWIGSVVPVLEAMCAAGYFLGDAVIETARRQAGE